MKTNRKLRKERKNRAKKVSFCLLYVLLLQSLIIRFSQFRGTKKAKAAELPKKGK